MKFAIAIVFTLALAMGVQSSYIPWGHSHLTEVAGHGLSYTAVSSPVHLPIIAHGPAAVAIHESPALYGHHDGLVIDAHNHPALVVDAHHHSGLIVDGHHHSGLVVDAHHHPALVVDAHHAHLHAPAAHIAHAHLGLAHEGTYIAKTRGAVHEAPLAGHIASAAAINVAPAPGTI